VTESSANPFAGVFKKLAGARVKYLLNASGKVETVLGTDELVERLGATGTGPAAMVAHGLLSEENLKEMGSLGSDLPAGPVKVGDTWTVTKEPSAEMGEMARTVKLTFQGWEDLDKHHCAVIESMGEMAPETDTPNSMPAKSSGKTLFDTKLGMVVASNETEERTMKASNAGQTMMSRTRTTSETKLVEVADLAK
jgi:hypothetical protein